MCVPQRAAGQLKQLPSVFRRLMELYAQWLNWCYEDLRKQSDMLIADELYQYRLGTTDSEAMFLIALSRGLKADQQQLCAKR